MGKDSLLLQPIRVGNLTLKNRIMFPPQTTGYEERDGSIGERSFNFYKRVAQGGSSYVVVGDVAPVMTASPTPKLCDDRQIPTLKKLADMMHEYDCKVALQIFHPEYDVPGVGRMIMMARKAMMEAQQLKEAGDKNLDADENQQCAAENACLAGQLCSYGLADRDACIADDKGNGGNHHRCQHRRQKIVMGDGEANGKGVDGGGNTLHQQRAYANEGRDHGAGAALDALVEHFAADVAE